MAANEPARVQPRVSNELRKKGTHVSSAGARCVRTNGTAGDDEGVPGAPAKEGRRAGIAEQGLVLTK